MDPFTIAGWLLSLLAVYVAIYYLLLYFELSEKPKKTGSRPEVTVAIPSYNEEENIYRALESLFEQDYPRRKIKVRVVDDGSSDGTALQVEKFIANHPGFDVKLIKNRHNRGKAYSLNRVLNGVETQILITMDADSEADPSAVRALVEYSDGVSVVTPCVLPTNKKGIFQRIQAVEYIYGNYLANLLSGFDAQIVAPGPFSLFKTSALQKIGGFDEDSVAEDLEVVFRLRKAGHSIRLSPKAYVYTNLPTGIRNFLKQRRRWRAGFLDAVEKHPSALTPSTEFGRQNFLNFIYVLMTLGLAFLVGRRLIQVARDPIDFLRYVGLDIWPYIRNFNFSIDLLSLDAQMIIYSGLLVVLTLVFLYLASQFHEMKPNLLDGALFLSIYGIAITMATLLAIYSWVKGEYTW